jgi:rhodanese-related sulfurtransferase
VFVCALLALGGPLFLASGVYYRVPFSTEMYVEARDVLNAQRALINFVERTAPPPGVQPNSNPVIFWYPNTSFMDSLSGTYISDYEALDAGHTHNPRLPYLDERGIAQLKAGYRREIVLVCSTAAECDAAEKALRDIGADFDVVGSAGFTGVKRSVLFTYIRITKIPI